MMKVIILAVTTIALIGLCLTWTAQAAPAQMIIDHTSLKNQLYKSIIDQALSQQEGSPSTKEKDKEMAATYCKLLLQTLQSISENLVDGSVDDFCNGDFELPTEPKPEEKSSILADTYKEILKALTGSLLNGRTISDLING